MIPAAADEMVQLFKLFWQRAADATDETVHAQAEALVGGEGPVEALGAELREVAAGHAQGREQRPHDGVHEAVGKTWRWWRAAGGHGVMR
jgi:hypothetical protein